GRGPPRSPSRRGRPAALRGRCGRPAMGGVLGPPVGKRKPSGPLPGVSPWTRRPSRRAQAGEEANVNARSGREVDELWRRFHEVVNMTSRELIDWLWMEPDLVPQPGPPQPPPLGVAVLKLLGKRRVDLTEDDLETMRKVIEVVEDETADVPYER